MLKGIIEPSSVAGVLRLLDDVGATGKLRLEAPGGSWTLAFWQGRVTGVEAPSGPAAQAPQDVSVDEHILTSVAEVLELSQGSFSWSAERIRVPEGLDALEVSELLPAAQDRNERLQLLRRVVSSPDCIPHIVAEQEGDAALQITSRQWRVLAFADGRRTVADIARDSGKGEFETLCRVAELIESGLVALDPRLEARARDEERLELASSPAFEIVTVCTGNRFRSPLAEAFIRAQLSGLPVGVHSFGLQDLGPAPALPEAQTLAKEMGVDLSEHRARPLEGADLSSADLVVVFERTHLARAVVDAKAPFKSTFLMIELVELLEQVDESPPGTAPITRARAALEEVQLKRAPSTSPSARGELVDPLGGPAGGYRATAEQLRDLSTRLVAALFGKIASEAVRR